MSLISTRFHAVMLRLSIFVLLTFLCSCASTIKEVPAKHVVMFDEYSRLLDPTGNVECTKTSPQLCTGKHLTIKNYNQLDEAQRNKYLDELFDEVKAWKGKRRLLIFVHGGLNTQTGSIKRVKELTPKIEAADYYPLFVNWRASWAFNYFEHLLYIRQGEEWKWYFGYPTSLVVLAYDIGRAVLRAPLVWGYQVYAGFQVERGAPLPYELAQREEILKAEQEAHPEHAIHIASGEDKRSDGEVVYSWVSGIFLSPFRFISSPLIDSFGTSAWDNMLRQTQLLLHPMTEYVDGHPNKRQGDLAAVMERIRDELKKLKQGKDQWEIVLVGHSMGTIVINELLRAFPDLPVDKIVYMAAACSVRDVEQSVLPYLRQNTTTKFYNLSLYHMAEEGEIHYLDLVMRGSLLSWIDDFFANPMTPRDKTYGQYANFLRTEQICPANLNEPNPEFEQICPPQLRVRIYQKEFSYGKSVSDTDPQKHGDFDRCPFWDERFYSPEPSAKDPKLVCSED